MLSLNVFVVIWEVNTVLMLFVDFLLLMGLYVKPHVLTLLNKMALLKENIVISLKQLALFYCLQTYPTSASGDDTL